MKNVFPHRQRISDLETKNGKFETFLQNFKHQKKPQIVLLTATLSVALMTLLRPDSCLL